jgi:S-adenosyl-L-methionine hydrolase (adenosine-forming)
VTGIITLLTDFGMSDGYVGAMKGAILSIAPNASVVDISHEVPAQDIRSGAFTLKTSTNTFPSGSVHVAVVDPGVGGARRALAVRVGESFFVGPDNGLLSWALAAAMGVVIDTEQLSLGPDVAAVSMDVPRYWRSFVSSTFHGRDIFGPVAAHLIAGEPLERMGSPVETIMALPWPAVSILDDRIVGQVLTVDHFGNCITNIGGDEVQAGDTIHIADRTISGLNRTYESSVALIAVIGSSGLLEVSIPGGSAAQWLDVQTGAAVEVKRG